jgi:Rod binding domain-containing protein
MGGVSMHGVEGSAGAQAAASPSPRLANAAHEFEGQMMMELLKPMTAGDALSADEEDSGAGSALGEFATESLAQAISRGGGLGIANRILGELSHFGSESAAGKGTGNLHADPVLRNHE